MDKITYAVSNSLAENNFIKREDIDIYRYGIEMFIICVLEMAFVMLISVIVGNVFEAMLFFIGFIPIRIYSGGYHAETRIGCFIILIFVYGIFSVINRYGFMESYSFPALIMILANMLLVYKYSPLPNVDKKPNREAEKIYRKRSLLFTVIISGIVVLFIALGIFNKYTQAMMLGLFTAALSLAAGKIKNIIKRREKDA